MINKLKLLKMKDCKIKILIFFLIGLMAVIGFLNFSDNNFHWNKKIVLADDDDDEEDEDEHDDEEEDEHDDDDDEKEYYEEELQEPTVETSSRQVSTYVSEKTVTTTIFDSDGDGIFDDEDQYPQINNHFIVEDENANGIVDEYEQ